MKEILNEEWLRQVLEAARDCRMRQLESEFAAWGEYREVEKVKEDMFKKLDEQLREAEREMLSLYDDAFSLMVGRAQDFFYERGFADCFRIFGRALARHLLDEGTDRKQS